MSDRAPACEFRDEHPELRAQLEEIDRRVTRVEGVLERREESRVADIRMFTQEVSAVHEKVNAVAADVAGLKGRLVILPLVGTAGGGIIVFVLQALFSHIGK